MPIPYLDIMKEGTIFLLNKALMDRLKAMVYLLAAFFGCITLPVNAQFNLKTGYNISFLSTPGVNDVISTFNSSQTYTKSFPKLTWMHGIEAGVRYKFGAGAFEATYQASFQQLRAEDDIPNSKDVYSDRIKFGIHSGAIGYQVSGKVIGFGTDLQYQWYRTKVIYGLTADTYKDVQNMLALKFYLMATLTGNKGVDIAIQPYWLMPFDEYNLNPLNHFLGQEGDPGSEKWTRFGLTILFYNGEKRW
jgi:hypothetical protein